MDGSPLGLGIPRPPLDDEADGERTTSLLPWRRRSDARRSTLDAHDRRPEREVLAGTRAAKSHEDEHAPAPRTARDPSGRSCMRRALLERGVRCRPRRSARRRRGRPGVLWSATFFVPCFNPHRERKRTLPLSRSGRVLDAADTDVRRSPVGCVLRSVIRGASDGRSDGDRGPRASSVGRPVLWTPTVTRDRRAIPDRGSRSVIQEGRRRSRQYLARSPAPLARAPAPPARVRSRAKCQAASTSAVALRNADMKNGAPTRRSVRGR